MKDALIVSVARLPFEKKTKEMLLIKQPFQILEEEWNLQDTLE